MIIFCIIVAVYFTYCEGLIEYKNISRICVHVYIKGLHSEFLYMKANGYVSLHRESDKLPLKINIRLRDNMRYHCYN